jgi:hypothetical protein
VGETALQRPRIEIQTIVVFAYRESIGATDTHRRLPLRYWFAWHKHVLVPNGKGLIARLGGEDSTAALDLWTYTSAPAENVPARRIANVVQLVAVSYRDVLEDDQTDYYLVSPWDYARISARDGRGLWRECQEKMAHKPPYEVYVSNQVGQMMNTDSLADVALNCPIKDHQLSHGIQIEPDSINIHGYPPRKRLEVPIWRRGLFGWWPGGE